MLSISIECMQSSLFDFCDTILRQSFFSRVSTRVFFMCKGMDEGGGLLELILFMTSTGAIYLAFSAGASSDTIWGWRQGES